LDVNDCHITYTSIGVIHSVHTIAEQTPIQPVFAQDCKGWVEVFPEFASGLQDLEGFSHIWIIYHFHRASSPQLLVKPFLQNEEHGIFATRAPCRPNPIGTSLVKLIKRDGPIIHLEQVDILDNTPLLDIKPYASKFDHIEKSRNGWQEKVDEATAWNLGKRNYKVKHSNESSA
jgi:tRNA (adenine37-N6)-methyltransferase